MTLFAGEEVSLVPTDADVNRTSGLRYKKSKDQARSEGVDSGEWTRLTPPETISAVPGGSHVDVRRRALTFAGPLGSVPEVSRT